MKNEQLIEKPATANVTTPNRKLSSFLQLAEGCERRRTIRICLPLPRRESCLTRRSMIAALREAELVEQIS